MKKYRNLFLLTLVFVLVVLVGGIATSLVNGMLESDNLTIAAQTSGISLKIMGVEGGCFRLNMVNSSEYEVDCLDGAFVLQRREGKKWTEVAAEVLPEQEGVDWKIPSGENRAFLFMPVPESMNPAESIQLEDGEYRICKQIYRDMEQENNYQYLMITADFQYPDVLSEMPSFEKPVTGAAIAAKLARTLVVWEEGMEDYWNPDVQECGGEEVLPEAIPAEAAEGQQWWRVSFAMKDGAEAAVAYVSKEDGAVYVDQP